MFGYITVNQPEMKIKEFDIYRSFYCGLCHSLREQYGNIGRITLSYDMTFLAMVLTGLYETETRHLQARCLTHTVRKHRAVVNEFSGYAADMNIILSYEKCLDDWKDERKITGGIGTLMMKGKNRKCRKQYEKKTEFILEKLNQIHMAEKINDLTIDLAAGYFGEIMGEIFVYKRDEWEEDLRKMGFYLGKFIYLMDAYEDIEEDIRTGNYNPFKELYAEEDFEGTVHKILTMMMAECCRAFERLPVVENIDIIRNILYSGVFAKYDIISRKRREKNVGSL